MLSTVLSPVLVAGGHLHPLRDRHHVVVEHLLLASVVERFRYQSMRLVSRPTASKAREQVGQDIDNRVHTKHKSTILKSKKTQKHKAQKHISTRHRTDTEHVFQDAVHHTHAGTCGEYNTHTNRTQSAERTQNAHKQRSQFVPLGGRRQWRLASGAHTGAVGAQQMRLRFEQSSLD